MTILNFFKKKKIEKGKEVNLPSLKLRQAREEKKKEGPPTGGKKEKPKEIEIPEQKVKREVKATRKHKIAHLILESPHIAEKSTRLYKIDQYVFKVYPKANKSEIKKAIEEIYAVDVLKVRTIKVPRRRRRLGKTKGWRKGYKKAIVTIKKGQEIEILPK